MYQSFQSCLETAEGTETFATEVEIRDCFIEAGFTGASDDNQDEDENEDDEDENENEDDEETNSATKTKNISRNSFSFLLL
jgi:hypothetical protein